MNLTADHDGRLVAYLIAEWATIHGQPFDLVLEGPAGGQFSQGVDGERVEIDAVDFVRPLSGRLPGRVACQIGPWRGQIALAIINDANEPPIDFAIALSEMLTDHARGPGIPTRGYRTLMVDRSPEKQG